MRKTLIASVFMMASLFSNAAPASAANPDDLECWVAVIIVNYNTETQETTFEYDWEYVC